jgi:hypothetical protein
VYRITITEHHPEDGDNEIVRYEQTVDDLDMRALILAINDQPPTPRARAPRSDKGVPKKKEAVATVPNDPFE